MLPLSRNLHGWRRTVSLRGSAVPAKFFGLRASRVSFFSALYPLTSLICGSSTRPRHGQDSDCRTHAAGPHAVRRAVESTLREGGFSSVLLLALTCPLRPATILHMRLCHCPWRSSRKKKNTPTPTPTAHHTHSTPSHHHHHQNTHTVGVTPRNAISSNQEHGTRHKLG